MIYVIEILRPGDEETRMVEMVAPSFFAACAIVASEWPRTQIVKLHGSYAEGTKASA